MCNYIVNVGMLYIYIYIYIYTILVLFAECHDLVVDNNDNV